MIPQKLQIKNFLSYGPEVQTINFEPYHLIYLSGKNGHGKSALLDAITWAIWGQARKVTAAVKPDEGLLRLGQINMLVALDFTLNNTLYRIRREFTVTQGKATTYLEFGVLNLENNEFISLSDKTIKATQQKINNTLRLDFDSFVNSAFLRQGHANEFSSKSPKERKDILISILGLEQFNIIKRAALEKTKEAQTEKQTLETFLVKSDEQLQKKEIIFQELKTTEEHLEKLSIKETTHLIAKKEIDSKKENLIKKQKEWNLISYRLQELQKYLLKNKEQIRILVSEWRIIHKKQLSFPDQSELKTHYTKITHAITDEQKKLQSLLATREEILLLKEKINKKTNELNINFSEKRQSLSFMLQQHHIERNTLTKEIEKIRIRKNEISKLVSLPTYAEHSTFESRLTPLIQQFERRKEAYQQFITHGNWIKSELENGVQKIDLLQANNPSCPLCEQNLTISRKKFLYTKFHKQKNLYEHQLKRLTRIIGTLKNILVEQHTAIEQIKKNKLLIDEWFMLDAQQSDYEKRVHEKSTIITEAEIKLTDQEKIDKEAINNNAEIVTLQNSLLDLEKKINTINYTEKTHQQLSEQLQKIETLLKDQEQITQEIATQKERQDKITELIEAVRSFQKDILLLAQESDGYKTLPEDEQNYQTLETTWKKEYETLVQQKELLLQTNSRLKTLLEQCELIEKESIMYRKKIADLTQIIYDYQIIATATGKDGIQALLIEQAIPEIENEANYLLSKLTNNQSHIQIESLRDLKKGGSKETLDIKISDPSGIRPYELFSGGEAFRIDFALRIAISKLLARRAGTALQTLIIDEGFGSQDEDGLALIMDAIYKIQDDFEKVIIVSHLPTMKDQFPVHFIVEKLPTGSTINVVEMG